MGTLADSLFSMLMSWVRALVNAIWALFSSDHTTVLEFLGKNWMLLAAAIIAAGLVIDWIVWLLRWQPYHLWAHRVRRLFGMEETEQEEAAPVKARAAKMPERRSVYAPPAQQEPEAEEESMDGDAAQEALAYAQQAPDEYAYPGMRFDSSAPQAMDSTQRYGAVTQEGPGAAEARRRKAEIEAWQRQMQEEARARAEAERMQREAEQARLRQEAEAAERARQQAEQAEQARLAQEEYARQLAEYEREKARYERELAEYERQKAAYEAHLAREAHRQEQAQELMAEIAPEQSMRRRRSERKSYSDYVEAESAYDLPPAPQWPQMPQEDAQPAPVPAKEKHRLLHQVAKMIEPEDEQLSARTKLPPRVNMQDAYKPAAAPRKSGRRNPKA